MNTHNDDSFSQQSKATWDSVHLELFGEVIPEEKVWTDLIDILHVLNVIGRAHNSNYIYTPNGGDVQLRSAKESAEPNCIELSFVDPAVVSPYILIFQSFGKNKQWNYFRLVTHTMEPSGAHPKEYYKSNMKYSESVIQVTPLYYSISKDWDEDGSRVDFAERKSTINRYYKGGDFVVFSYFSPFNKIWDKKPGIHQRLCDKGFKRFIKARANEESSLS